MLPDREEACCGGDICHIQQLSPSRTDNINTNFHNKTEILIREETLTLLDMRREFGCDRILARFLEQDLKFESLGNLDLNYSLLVIQT